MDKTLQNLDLYFKQHQKEIVKLVNSEYGRHLFNIKDKEPIVKVSPNSIHQLMGFEKDRAVVKGKFYCGKPVVAVQLMPILEKMELASKDDKYIRHIIENPYKAFLHFAELEKSRYLPQIFLTQFNVGAGDGATRNNNAVYLTAHDAASSNVVDYTSATAGDVGPGQALSGGLYYVGRVFLPADTSAITSVATIVAGGNSVNFYPGSIRNVDSVTLNIVTTTQASTSSLVAGDFAQTGTTVNGSATFASLTAAQINTVTLNSTGDGNINKTGFTKFGFRLAEDISSTPPTGDSNDFGGAGQLSMSEHATSAQRPYLTIIYTVPRRNRGFIIG